MIMSLYAESRLYYIRATSMDELECLGEQIQAIEEGLA